MALKISETEKKTLSFFMGIILAAYGITNISKNEFGAILIILLGAYLVIKGLE